MLPLWFNHIEFPNTAQHEDFLVSYQIGKNADFFKRIQKNGEMAKIDWIQVFKDGLLIAEIKENTCTLRRLNNVV
jgi:hypothetical protein